MAAERKWSARELGEIERRWFDALRRLDEVRPPSRDMTRLHHSLQFATWAARAGADVDVVVASLMHDVGHALPLVDHARVASEMLGPFVRPEVATLVRWHTVLGQGMPAPEHLLRFEWTAQFVRWDRDAWRSDVPWRPLDAFRPLVSQLVSRRPTGTDSAECHRTEAIHVRDPDASSCRFDEG